MFIQHIRSFNCVLLAIWSTEQKYYHQNFFIHNVSHSYIRASWAHRNTGWKCRHYWFKYTSLLFTLNDNNDWWWPADRNVWATNFLSSAVEQAKMSDVCGYPWTMLYYLRLRHRTIIAQPLERQWWEDRASGRFGAESRTHPSQKVYHHFFGLSCILTG